MAPHLAPATPMRLSQGRPRGRPKRSMTGSSSRTRNVPSDAPASEPPLKKLKYIPGGPGGGGRFVDENGNEQPHNSSLTVPRPRAPTIHLPTPSPALYPTRERSTRIRTAVNRDEQDNMQYSSAAAVAAAVAQGEGYKPREERGWEDFHPNLDIEANFMVFRAEEVDGTVKETPPIPPAQRVGTPTNGPRTASKESNSADTSAVVTTPNGHGQPFPAASLADTPSRRRIGRPARDSFSLYATRPAEHATAPKTPKVLPIHNQTPKERLDLKLPSYRRTDRIALFESKTFGQARYVDKSMMNVGYQESDNFIRPDRLLIKSADANIEEDLDPLASAKGDADAALHNHAAGPVGRVEYDMDEQDDVWLGKLNEHRKATDLDQISREVFEIVITKIEKEWHVLEKKIPKPNPKPPQTHRPRSSSAAAVNGEPHAGEEQDSKCAICDDGDCENTNAIVFCDGCDLAVHQECYGVPFIPEGQWLCRKCQLIGRGIPTCIFCPNTDGAFKQTNSSKWAHLLCAMWIPEVSLGNHTFMEPVMEVEKVPRNRWRLLCYICEQQMGACIQCSSKNCYQAFHVSCARRCRLYLKMKSSQGALTVLDGAVPLKAYCDKHCPDDYGKEHDVAQRTREAMRFYRRTMKGRIWADSQASALHLAATYRRAIVEHPPDESQMTSARLSAVLADKKKGQAGKHIWKLPSGAPIIPQLVYDLVESSMQRFPIRKRKEFVGEACRYWTLKREARRGAALLKRLQLQMETFSSMELTRRNFAAMGPSGKARLTRRIDFAKDLLKDLEQLKSLAAAVVEREAAKLEEAEMEQDFVDTCYFPIFKLLQPVLERAFTLDKNIFKEGLNQLQDKVERRYYTTTLQFAHDLCEAINVGINTETKPSVLVESRFEPVGLSPIKPISFAEARDRRRLGKRILKSVQPQLEAALKAEMEINNKPLDDVVQELERMIDVSLEVQRPNLAGSHQQDGAAASSQDQGMDDAPAEGQIIVAGQMTRHDGSVHAGESTGADAVLEEAGVKREGGCDSDGRMDVEISPASMNGAERSIQVSISVQEGDAKPIGITPPNASVGSKRHEAAAEPSRVANGTKDTDSPSSVAGYLPATQVHHSGPLTPPQSNGSLGTDHSDILTEGGLPLYMRGFEFEGTSVVEEQWGGREAVRSLSEELTDMDDDALKDLEFDVDDDTITASPVRTVVEPSSATTSTRKTRASTARKRKGVRTSARLR